MTDPANRDAALEYDMSLSVSYRQHMLLTETD